MWDWITNRVDDITSRVDDVFTWVEDILAWIASLEEEIDTIIEEINVLMEDAREAIELIYMMHTWLIVVSIVVGVLLICAVISFVIHGKSIKRIRVLEEKIVKLEEQKK